MTQSCCSATLSRQHTGAVPLQGTRALGEEPAIPCPSQPASVRQLDGELVLAACHHQSIEGDLRFSGTDHLPFPSEDGGKLDTQCWESQLKELHFVISSSLGKALSGPEAYDWNISLSYTPLLQDQ